MLKQENKNKKRKLNNYDFHETKTNCSNTILEFFYEYLHTVDDNKEYLNKMQDSLLEIDNLNLPISLTNQICDCIFKHEDLVLNCISMCPYIQIVIKNKDS